MPIQTSMEQVRWLRFRNEASETAPPHAVMRVTGAVAIEGVMVLTVAKPDGTDGTFVLNSRVAIPYRKYGRCTLDMPWQAKYTTGDGTPAVGEEWGPDEDWALHKDKPGFVILSAPISNVAGIVPVHNKSGGEGSPIIRFEITADKAWGEDTVGEKLELVDNVLTKDGVTIALVDTYGVFGAALAASDDPPLSGAQGWAVRMADRPTMTISPHGEIDAYEILFIESKSRFAWVLLTEDMGYTSSGQAAANPEGAMFGGPDHAHDPSSSSITVFDVHGRWTHARSGSLALVVLNEKLDRYEIVYCDLLARHARVTLTEDMGATESGEASASVTTAFGSPFNGQSPGASITVLDVQGQFPRALSGANGRAVFNDVSGEYELVSCEQECYLVTATAGAAFSSGSGSISSVSSIANMLGPPFSQTPTISSATNPRNHAGESGDQVVLLRNFTTGNWEVIGVTKKEVDLPIEWRWNSANLRIEYKRRKAAIEFSEPLGDWETAIQYYVC